MLQRVGSGSYVQIGMIRCTMVCLSYRGYWTSTGRPSEQGLNKDAAAGLRWIADSHAEMYAGREKAVAPLVLLWGQSIGAAIATQLAAQAGNAPADTVRPDAVILETPLLSTRALLAAIYPQRWAPYRYLWPLLWNRLDTWSNLGEIARQRTSSSSRSAAPSLLILEAGRDELVPAAHGDQLFQRCQELGLAAERRAVQGALHNEAMASPRAESLSRTSSSAASKGPWSTTNSGRQARDGLCTEYEYICT